MIDVHIHVNYLYPLETNLFLYILSVDETGILGEILDVLLKKGVNVLTVSSEEVKKYRCEIEDGLDFRDFDYDDWLLYSLESPNTSGARGFAKGNFFTRNGMLVASVAQEGLMRPK